MRANYNLHRNAPDESEIAIVLIDVINDLEFDEGERFSRRRYSQLRVSRN